MINFQNARIFHIQCVQRERERESEREKEGGREVERKKMKEFLISVLRECTWRKLILYSGRN